MTSRPFQHFCNIQHDPLSLYEAPGILSQASQDFLASLNLASVHPFCTSGHEQDAGETTLLSEFQDITTLHTNQNDTFFSYDTSTDEWSEIVKEPGNSGIKLLWMMMPSIIGLLELVCRLVASMIVPIFLLWNLWKVFLDAQQRCFPKKQYFESASRAFTKNNAGAATTSTVSVRCATFLMMAIGLVVTDTLCIQEIETFRSFFLAYCAIFLALLRLFSIQELHLNSNVAKCLLLCFAVIVTCCFWFLSYEQRTKNIDEGLYYSLSNDRAQKIIDHWPSFKRSYDLPTTTNTQNKINALVPTQWMLTGDWRTIFPFLLNFVPQPPVSRVWFEVDDGEVVALDISFPTSAYNASKPVYFVLHGLNGGSGDEFIKDFTWRSMEEGSTIVVMVARGYMDLPLRGLNGFHAARWQDAFMAAKAIRAALGNEQLLIGVGYSMGGIILNNMIAQSGEDCPLDAAITISSALDIRLASAYPRAWRMWHPFLAAKFRHSTILNKMGYERLRQRLPSEQIQKLMSIKDVLDLEKIMAQYHGFRDWNHYFSEASVLGDMTNHDLKQSKAASKHKVSNISIPLCVVHAMDDPILSWRSVASNQGFMHPMNLVKSGKGNLMLLLTKRGGHVGWPVGINLHSRKWQWVSDLVLSFGDAFFQSA